MSDEEDPSVYLQHLHNREILWRDKQVFLQSKGYMLRSRYRPNWVPSWLTSGRHPFRSEDGIELPLAGHLIDAIRVADGKMVYIKRIEAGNFREASLATALYADPLRQDPMNHTVPIYEVFSDPEAPDVSYMVMPFLRYPDDPPFESVGEVMEFVDQVLEGLVFMHDQGVAHRDCALANIMMDASRMYPDSFHPVHLDHAPDGFIRARRRPRSRAGVKYYFIDYGISSVFGPGQSGKLVTGVLGRDQDAPELSDVTPYDPFAVDVFLIGNMLRTTFLEIYSNTEFLKLLILRATHPTPSDRPTARDLLRLWVRERRHISFLDKAWRLQKRDELAVVSVARDCLSMLGSVFSYAGSFAR
ncbi:hypothetical protein PENSPDRAFT_753941 [Peniophora sp. CONT]|nr:hypothetical protein PENSPDRAFT_753941 [Peniophora sp. CONT]